MKVCFLSKSLNVGTPQDGFGGLLTPLLGLTQSCRGFCCYLSGKLDAEHIVLHIHIVGFLLPLHG